jgi:hypothetical protein
LHRDIFHPAKSDPSLELFLIEKRLGVYSAITSYLGGPPAESSAISYRRNQFGSLLMKQSSRYELAFLIVAFLICLVAVLAPIHAQNSYETVIVNGRVMDPEFGLNAIRHVGITAGKMRAISPAPLSGKSVIDAKRLVVAPGFIDLHEHGQTPNKYRYQANDGVTTSLELEVGTDDVDRWYAERQSKSVINYDVSIGHIPVRMTVMHDPGAFTPRGDAARRLASWR